MITLELSDGDLVIGPNGHETVTGPRKIIQDLRGAVLEPLGNDRFHPGYGSRLDAMIGSASASAPFDAQQEVVRIVQQYVAVQRDQIERDALSGQASRFTTGDIISEFVGARATVNADRVTISVSVLTAANVSVAFGASSGQ